MKIINITHYDLDGAVSNIVVKNAFINSEVLTYTAVYKNLDKILNNALSYIDSIVNTLEDFCVIITDLSIDNYYLKEFLKSTNVKHLMYFDHHLRTDENLLEEINNSKFVYKYDNQICGAQITYDFFKKEYPKIKHNNLDKLVYLTNIYDLYKTKDADFVHAYDLNTLFWEYKFDGFIESYNNGIDNGLLEEHKRFINEQKDKLQQYMLDVKNNHYDSVDVMGTKVGLIIKPEPKFINETTMFFSDNILLVFKNAYSDLVEYSIRVKEEYDFNVDSFINYLSTQYSFISGGGHEKAGGVICKVKNIELFPNIFIEELEKFLQQKMDKNLIN